MSQSAGRSLGEIFSEFRPRIVDPALTDFSRLRTPPAPCWQVAPRHADTAAAIARMARAHNVPLRIRAQGHSLNGSSLPHPAELLVSTRNLRHVRFEAPGTVTVGSGVVLWVLQRLLRERGFDLPVLNDGYPGPSVGGYAAAGGFGPRSAVYGGFWDNVTELHFVDGLGDTRRVTRTDPLFPWFFGSMGQLGILIDARLNIIDRDGARPSAYPAGTALQAPELVAPRVPPEYQVEADERLFWFTIFTPDENLDETHQALRALEKRHGSALRFQERYRYPIRQMGRVAPLVYPFARPFTATGAWGWLTDASPAGIAALDTFDRDFMELAASQSHYRRYVQSELPAGPATYLRCFGERNYPALRELKRELDPASLLNRGTVFPAA